MLDPPKREREKRDMDAKVNSEFRISTRPTSPLPRISSCGFRISNFRPPAPDTGTQGQRQYQRRRHRQHQGHRQRSAAAEPAKRRITKRPQTSGWSLQDVILRRTLPRPPKDLGGGSWKRVEKRPASKLVALPGAKSGVQLKNKGLSQHPSTTRYAYAIATSMPCRRDGRSPCR